MFMWWNLSLIMRGLSVLFLFNLSAQTQAAASASLSYLQQDPPLETSAERPIALQDLRQFRHIGPAAGWSASTVNAIAQDHQGYMWFGTMDSLARYDGYEFVHYYYDPDNPYSISQSAIYALEVDRDGTLWVGTWGSGLNRYDRQTGRFTRFVHDENDPTSLSSNVVRRIYADRDNTIWVGTSDGLNRFDRETETFVRYQHDPEDPTSLGRNFIQAIYEDHTGALWLGTYWGLDRFDRETTTFTHYLHDPQNPASLLDNQIWSLYEDSRSNLWVGSAGGLSRFEPASETFVNYIHDPQNPNSIANAGVMFIQEDSNGMLWIGTYGDSLNAFDRDTETFTHYRHDSADASTIDAEILIAGLYDGNGLLWIGSADTNYISVLDTYPQPFTLLRNPAEARPDGMAAQMVAGMHEDSDGDLWMIILGHGATRYSPKTGVSHDYLPNPNDPNSLSTLQHWHVFRSPTTGHVWFGSIDGFVDRLDPETGIFTQFRHDPDDPTSLSNGTIYLPWEDPSGTLWISAKGGGLNRFDPETDSFIHYRHDPNNPNSLSSDLVWDFTSDHAGNLWIGTEDGGLNRFDPVTETFSHFRHDPTDPNSLSNDNVMVIHEASDGYLWVGTWNGLNRFDPVSGASRRFYAADGLAADRVQGIVEDQLGYIWIIHGTGLSRINPETLAIRTFDARNQGLPAKYTIVHRSYTSGRDGQLYFGTPEGLLVVWPELLEADVLPPEVLLTDFLLANESEPTDDESILSQAIDATDSVTLAYTDNIFSIDFAAMDYRAPERIRYRYRLLGFNDEWTETGSSHRRATYTNLAPGSYTFEVNAASSDGDWSEITRSLDIVITPPWWQTNLFRLLAILTLVGASLAAYYVRTRELRRMNRILETQVSERTTEISSLLSIARAINTSLDLPVTLEHVLNNLHTSIDYDLAVVFTLEGDLLKVGAQRGLELPSEIMQSGFRADAIPLFSALLNSRQAVLVEDIQAHESTRLSIEAILKRPMRTRGWITITLVAQGEVIGILTLSHQQPGFYTDKDLQFAYAFAGFASTAIRNARLHERSLSAAIMGERQRLARDLHDSTTQLVYGTALLSNGWGIQASQNRLSDIAGCFNQIEKLSLEALRHLRSLIYQLRPLILEEVGLIRALQNRFESVELRLNIDAQLTVAGKPPPLPYQVEEEVYHIVIEALNNALRHAHATRIRIAIETLDEQLVIRVEDDGKGFDTQEISHGMGLDTMEVRANTIGAKLFVDTLSGRGTTVHLLVPLLTPGETATATIPHASQETNLHQAS